MLTHQEIHAYGQQLVLCPYCGANGHFDIISEAGIDTIRTKCNGCGHASADFYPTKGNAIRLLNEWPEGSPATSLGLPTGQPVIVNYGGGVDSTAMLVAMVKAGVKPDLIIFADPGSEKLETYAYVDFFDGWLQQQGFPAITRVAYSPVSAPYTTLEGNVLANQTLPAISFRKKNCTLKFKAAVMDSFILGISRGVNKKEGWAPAIESLSKGIKPVKAIGYDFGPIDSCRSVNLTEDDHFRYLYPLRNLKWSREDCITAIKRAGLPQPIKSACFYCSSSKPWELNWLAAEHPELLVRSLLIEDTARHGKHGLGNVQGLWGQKESWRSWCENTGVIAPGTYRIIASKEVLLRKAREGKPPLESNLDFELALPSMNKVLPVPDIQGIDITKFVSLAGEPAVFHDISAMEYLDAA